MAVIHNKDQTLVLIVDVLVSGPMTIHMYRYIYTHTYVYLHLISPGKHVYSGPYLVRGSEENQTSQKPVKKYEEYPFSRNSERIEGKGLWSWPSAKIRELQNCVLIPAFFIFE